MVVLVVALLLCCALTVLAGVAAYRWGHAPAGGPTRWAATLARRIGGLPAAAVCFVAGAVVSAAVMLPLGLLAKALQHGVDDPVYRAVRSRVPVPDHSLFGKFNDRATLIGDRAVVDAMIIAAVIILGVLFGRRWWIPATVILVIAVMQYEGQVQLARIIDRGYPPVAGSGTFPSGGVSRLVAVYGAVAVLVVALLPHLARRHLVRTWTGIMLFGVIEAFTRVYLSEHWLTDALAGLVFGAVLLVTARAAVAALGTPGSSPDDARRIRGRRRPAGVQPSAPAGGRP